jgi:tetratricopeptide (TPR) repeat protein
LGESDGADVRIGLKAWSPDTPYLKALQAAPAAEAYDVYLQQRKSYEGSPAFYLDCADFFAKASPEIALRILTNIPELGLDDGRLLRIAAHRLQQLGHLDLAIDLFEKVAKLRPEEPQSFRDLALALADRADGYAANSGAERARSDYERSLQLLHKVVMNPWQRFDEIEVIALTEANRIFARAATSDRQHSVIANPFDPRLVKLLGPDLRIVMTWDTDNTDIDLHVVEPTGETCVYNHNRTTIGGALSRDFTQGYGPEEYMLRNLMPGEYKIRAHFYGNRDQRLVGPTTVQATVITHFGRPDEKRQAITLRLKDAKDMVDIGSVTLR